MQLSSLEFPVAFYGISEDYGNNYLTLAVQHTPIDVSGTELESSVQTFIIPDGNYNASDLINVFNEILCPMNNDATMKYPTSIFSYIQLSLDITSSGSGSGKVTIGPSGQHASSIREMRMDFTLDKNGNKDSLDVSSKIGWNLGFIKPKYRGKSSYTADTIIEPAAIRYVYLAIDDFNNSASNQFMSVFNKSIVHPDILARISIKGSYFSLIMESDFNIVTEPRRYFGPVDIQRLRVRIYDEHGRILPIFHDWNRMLLFSVMPLYPQKFELIDDVVEEKNSIIFINGANRSSRMYFLDQLSHDIERIENYSDFVLPNKLFEKISSEADQKFLKIVNEKYNSNIGNSRKKYYD
jgi:hypothetical protein